LTFSKRYGKLRQKHQELCRIVAENRTFAIREQVNHLRTLGDCFVTEPANAKKLFKTTGGTYIEVPMEYRASQYDHTADTYIKKKLSQRMYCLTDGTKV
jgi:hypothetical protein